LKQILSRNLDKLSLGGGALLIKIKRIYEKSSKDDGFRILVDRLWPRGMSKSRAAIGLWLRDIAPSDELRKWFSHMPEKWDEFVEKYRKELQEKGELLKIIKKAEEENETVTLVYSAKDVNHNNAVALSSYLRSK
jgi:uncharacterized protein YeaO (DUF488 family)